MKNGRKEVLVKLGPNRSDGLSATVLFPHLFARHGGAYIDVQTRRPCEELLFNPYVRDLLQSPQAAYDQVVDLTRLPDDGPDVYGQYFAAASMPVPAMKRLVYAFTAQEVRRAASVCRDRRLIAFAPKDDAGTLRAPACLQPAGFGESFDDCVCLDLALLENDGWSFREIAAVVARADVLVTVENAFLCVAAAVGTPTVLLCHSSSRAPRNAHHRLIELRPPAGSEEISFEEARDAVGTLTETAVDVSIIVVGNQLPQGLSACLRSIEAACDAETEIVVVDNGSDKSGPLTIVERDGGWIERTVRLEKPVSFPEAATAGAAWARGKTLIFLDHLSQIKAGFDRALHESIAGGTCSFAVPLLTSDDRIISAGADWDAQAGAIVRRLSGESPDAAGPACPIDGTADLPLAVTEKAFWKAGGFDNAYKAPGVAAADLCLKLRSQGGRGLFVPQAVALRSNDNEEFCQADLSTLCRRWGDTSEPALVETRKQPDTVPARARLLRPEVNDHVERWLRKSESARCVMFPLEDFRRHMDNGRWLFQLGLEACGWISAGRHMPSPGIDSTNVRQIVEGIQPDIVLFWPPYEWDIGGKDRVLEDWEFLGRRDDILKVAVVHDAGAERAACKRWHELLKPQVWLTWYHSASVCSLNPHIPAERTVRTYHLVKAEALPPVAARQKVAAIGGAINREVYPLRTAVFEAARRGEFDADIEPLLHPGYHHKGGESDLFAASLAQFKVAVCGSSIFGFALRKHFEATAAGCIVITDLPDADCLPGIDENLVRIPEDIGMKELREIVREAACRWELRRQIEMAHVARSLYDYRVETARVHAELLKARRDLL